MRFLKVLEALDSLTRIGRPVGTKFQLSSWEASFIVLIDDKITKKVSIKKGNDS